MTDAVIRYSHRTLLACLVFVLVLGGAALAALILPSAGHAWQQGALLLPLALVATVAWLRTSAHGISADAIRQVQRDELRALAEQRATRHAFGAALLLQPVLAVLVTMASLPRAPAVMAAATVTIAVTTFLASVLAYDR